MTRFLPKSAREFAVDIGRALRGEVANDRRIRDYIIMKEMGWSEEELKNTSMDTVMGITFITNKKNIRAEKEKEKMRKDGRS